MSLQTSARKPDAVIYVPGLSDHRSSGQQLVVRLWAKMFGVTTAVYTMCWNDKSKSFSEKLEGLLARIDELGGDGYRVSLVGTSAGASAVLNAFAERTQQVHRVVYICGKVT